MSDEIQRLERRILQLVEQLGQLRDSLDYSEQKWRKAREENEKLRRVITLLEGEARND